MFHYWFNFTDSSISVNDIVNCEFDSVIFMVNFIDLNLVIKRIDVSD